MNELHKHTYTSDDTDPKSRKRRKRRNLVAASLAGLLASSVVVGCSTSRNDSPTPTERATTQQHNDTPKNEAPEFGSQGELGELESRAVELIGSSPKTIVEQVSELFPPEISQKPFEDYDFNIVPGTTVSVSYFGDEHDTSFGAISFEDFRDEDASNRYRLDLNFRMSEEGPASDLSLRSLYEGLDDGSISVDVVHSISPDSMAVALLDESWEVKSIEYQEFLNGRGNSDSLVVQFDKDGNSEYNNPELAFHAYSLLIGSLSTIAEGSIAQQIARSHEAHRANILEA